MIEPAFDTCAGPGSHSCVRCRFGATGGAPCKCPCRLVGSGSAGSEHSNGAAIGSIEGGPRTVQLLACPMHGPGPPTSAGLPAGRAQSARVRETAQTEEFRADAQCAQAEKLKGSSPVHYSCRPWDRAELSGTDDAKVTEWAATPWPSKLGT